MVSLWCGKRDLNPYIKDTRPSNVRVCRFRHSRECFTIILDKIEFVKGFLTKKLSFFYFIFYFNKFSGAKTPLIIQHKVFLCIVHSNFDLSRTMFAQTRRLFCPLFQKWRPARSSARAARAHSAFLFGNFFFAPMLSKKKWMKKFWYQRLVCLL